MEGIYAIYKPSGMTSHDVIHQLRLMTGVQRIGHAGTLDPSAQGVLVVAIGRSFTKQLSGLLLNDKEYVVDAEFGAYSTTDDAEGEKQAVNIKKIPSQKEVQDVLSFFHGEIVLAPPAFSALKIHGKRAYALARKGKKIDLPKRKAFIFENEFIFFTWPHIRFRVVTASGVYVRSIVRAMGDMLGCGAYVLHLERTRVGEYTKNMSIQLKDFKETITK